ncbi:MAG: AraC family transcriptional regulator ligand-binding domain-containing protein [Pseudomonadota bacterium]
MTIAASLAASFIDYAEDRDVDRAEMLSAASLTDADLHDPDGRIKADAYGAVLDAAIRRTGDTGLPMRHAADQRLDHLSIVGLIVATASPLSEVITQLNRYVRLVADIPLPQANQRFELDRAGAETWLVDTLLVDLAGPDAIEATFASFASSFRHAEPDIPLVVEVAVTFDRPPRADLYEEIFQAPVMFCAERNALRIHPHWVTTTDQKAKPYALGLFIDHAETLLEVLRDTSTFRARVEEKILQDLHRGPVSRGRVARDLAVSERTLHRRLKDEGLTYAEVYDGVRDTMAREYLKSQKATVAEVAFLLGFSETSAFVRAFRRWTGLSPSDFRQTLI